MGSTILWIMVVTAIAGVGGTGIGGIVGALIKRNSEKMVSVMLSFAGGVMISVVCFDLISKAISPKGEVTTGWLMIGIAGVVLGFCIVALLNYIIDKKTNHEISHIDEEHPRTADDLDELIHSDHYFEHKKENRNLFIAGIVMAMAIALHNLPEGVAIGVSYVKNGTASVWGGSGLIMAMVIGLHNIPEGMAVSVPLIAGGMNRAKAVIVTALSGAPTIIGAALGYLLGSISDIWNSVSLGFAAGAMIYIVFGELIPESCLMVKSKAPSVAVLVGIICGLMVVYL